MICEYCGSTQMAEGRCTSCGHTQEHVKEKKTDHLLSKRSISYEGHSFYSKIPGQPIAQRQSDRGPSDDRNIPKSLRFAVLARDNYTCQYCGKRAPNVTIEVDHMVSWKDGGKTSIDNLVTSCRDCNRGKSSRSIA